MRLILPLAAFATLAVPTVTFAASAVQKECSTRYQAAKSANTLAGQTYNQYYKQCAAELRAEKAGGAAPAAPAPTVAPALAPAPAAAPAPTTTAAQPRPTAAPIAAGAAVFPAAVSPQYSTLKPGKARFNTCLDQYRANKATNGNGGLKWLAHEGYYSQCNTRLKG